jgi:peptidoglycan hydrolase CwlO-like protein
MSSATRIFTRPFGVATVLVLGAAVLFALGAHSPTARAADPGALAQRISAGQSRVSAISGAVGADNARLRQVDASITELQSKIARIQTNLDAKRAELLRLRRELDAAQVKLGRLKAYERTAKSVLSQMLVAGYENDQPDLVSVVLASSTFSNLLDRLSFAKRIRNHDQQIVAAVIIARDRVAAQAVHLAGLEGRQQDVTARVLAERDQLDAAKLTLLDQQMAVTRARNKHLGQLTAARSQVASLRRQLAHLHAEQAQQAARAAAAAQAATGQTAPSGLGAVSTDGDRAGPDPIPGFTIGRDDMGVDATAPTGTGIYAPLASRLVLVLQDWYTSEPLLLFQFDSPPPGALSDYWYVAEQIDPVTTAVGTSFQAGQRVASYAASGTGIEIGWGSTTANTRTLAGATDPAAANPPAGSTTIWGESFKSAFGIP